MESKLKALEGTDNSPLLPVSDNANSNPYVQQSRKSHYISEVRIVDIIVLMVTFGTILSSPSVFTFMSLPPQTPSFQLDSLFLSNFNISNTTFRTDWDTTLTIENPNMISTVNINSIKGLISYKDNSLAMYSIKPLELGCMEHRLVHVKISTMTTNRWIFEEINRQRDENEAVRFNMTMFVSPTYTSGWWGIENVVLNPRCMDLKVAFLPRAGFGSWVNRGPKKCSLPIL
ncbi:PREDICTED: uncharacterized protein LOC101294768 [Fragaria vesca subsp. vesca]|uniref:uncharacterized protein LOC101294768 n=1 Tax=Fragaria vesca subsp. vesca TaxID=101020 RepID=UPI0002C2E935|nr:PREDICTED: uncharacterized protein LOC101294768 [Fragaria vesca subsp. vesca]